MMRVQIINHIDPSLDGDIAKIAEVLQQYDTLVSAAHDMAYSEVTFVPGATEPADGYLELGFFETSDVADAVGYHDLTPKGAPYGKVFRGSVPNGEMLRDVTGHGQSCAGCASHEYAEMKGDRFANLWAVGQITDPAHPRRKYSLLAVELADPCQDNAFTLKSKDGTEVDCSDFVKPNYFNPDTPADEPTSHLGSCKGPMVCAPGGYLIVAQEAGETQVFGRTIGGHHERVLHADVAPPEWREAIRLLPYSRSSRRAKHSSK
jgi:hypothetical protein